MVQGKVAGDESPGNPTLAVSWASLWLAIFLVAAKGFSLRFDDESAWGKLLFLVAAAASDILFAGACGLFAAALCWLWKRSRRGSRLLWAALLFLFAFFVFYAVVAIGLYRYFNRPLTFDLLGLVGNAESIRSSIAERMTWPLALGLILAPLLYLWLATRRPARRAIFALGAIALCWVAGGAILQARGWERQRLEFARLSPHIELLRNSARRLTGGTRPKFPRDFPPEYLNEFRTFGARGKGTAHFATNEARPKNVIVVVLESVGTKYLGLYGAARDPMPALTAEARQALVFENIYAHASFTYASFRPLAFSVYPGLPWHYALLEDARLLPETLAAKMKERGARTAYITSGDLDWGDQRWLLGRRDNFDLTLGAADLGCPLVSSWGAEDRCAIDRLLGWVAQEPARPFFAIVWTDQTHDPYRLSDQQKAQTAGMPAVKPGGPFAHDLERYLRVLRATDTEVARIFAFLRERGLADDTLVVVTGDHGEAFADPHSQRGHAWSVFEEEVRVPLLLWNPRLFPEGGRAATIGGHVDVNPTIADVLKLEPAGEWQGWSLFDPARPPRAYFFAIAGGNVFGVREGEWKYSYDVTNGAESLFHLPSDPREQTNLSEREPERARRLRQRVAAFVTFEEAYLWGREN